MDQYLVNKLLLNQGKTGILETYVQTMEVRIEGVYPHQNLLKFFTTEGLKKLVSEISKSPALQDEQQIYDIQNNPGYFRILQITDVVDFTPLLPEIQNGFIF